MNEPLPFFYESFLLFNVLQTTFLYIKTGVYKCVFLLYDI